MSWMSLTRDAIAGERVAERVAARVVEATVGLVQAGLGVDVVETWHRAADRRGAAGVDLVEVIVESGPRERAVDRFPHRCPRERPRQQRRDRPLRQQRGPRRLGTDGREHVPPLVGLRQEILTEQQQQGPAVPADVERVVEPVLGAVPHVGLWRGPVPAASWLSSARRAPSARDPRSRRRSAARVSARRRTATACGGG